MWEYKTVNPSGDIIYKDNKLDYKLYKRWKKSIWKCQKPIRYPNTRNRVSRTQFTLLKYKNSQNKIKKKRLDYIQSRKRIYYKEYIRLARKTKEYQELLQMLINGKHLLISEIDVPAKHKKSIYSDCDDNNNCKMTIKKLNKLIEDPNEPFGHGLCLAKALLLDLKDYNKKQNEDV